MYAQVLKMLFPSAVMLVAIFAVGTLEGCNEPYFCEPCDREILCPREEHDYITFICPENLTCYVNGQLACVSEECSGKENETKVYQCPTSGTFSDRRDCTKMITCFPRYDDTYEVVEDECPLGLHFNDEEGSCTTPDKTTCHMQLIYLEQNMTVAEDDEFECQQIGIFPDSDYAEYFYVCEIEDVELKKLRMKCPEDMEFYPYESMCISSDFMNMSPERFGAE